MCTLAIYFRAFPTHPLVIAANRDEFLARPTHSPAVIGDEPWIFAGRDAVAGGTWLGVNGAGVAAALLNRRTEEPADPCRRSRGLLCLSVLGARTAAEARDGVAAEAADDYNPFNLLIADRGEAWVASNHGGTIRQVRLEEGVHVLTNLDVDDPRCPRIASSHRQFADVLAGDTAEPGLAPFVDRVRRILSQHDTPVDPRDPSLANSLCLHLGEYGTRSSTQLFLDHSGSWSYFHVDAAPCRADYRRLALPSD